MRFSSSLAAVAVGALLVSSAVAQQAGHRTIEYAPNMPIAARLLPGDEVVQVHRPYDYPVFDPEPGPRDVLHGLLRGRYGTAVLIDVRSVSGALVENGRWIETVFEGSVVETLSAAVTDGRRVSPLPKGKVLTSSLDGGAVTIGKVLVRTTGSLSFPTNQRYLVFLGPYPDPDTGHLRLGTDPVLVRGNKLVGVSQSDTKLAGLSLEDVRSSARRVKR